MNKLIMAGNIGKTSELRYTQSGKAVLSFSMATNENWKDTNGEWKTSTEWTNVVVWGKRAESFAERLLKGTYVLVEGKKKTRSYENKEGRTVYITELEAAKIDILSRKDKKESTQAELPVEMNESDIPF